jgi:peptidoglycan/LPS O-acetylase OafA/YrhL
MRLSILFKRPEQNYKVIDGIRAIAILWVILFHVWLFQSNIFPELTKNAVDIPFLTWITRGDLGVDLFFVISGFLIGTILFKEYQKNSRINFKKFYIRRFFRLIPVYTFAMIIAAYFLKGTGLDNWQDSWSNFIYVNNYITGSYMPWTWSLAIEEQFYIVAPFLIAFVLPLFKRKYLFFGILALIPIGFTYYYSVNLYHFKIPFEITFPNDNWMHWFWDYYMLTHLRYGGLLCGIIAAYLNVFYKARLIEYYQNQKGLNDSLVVISMVIFVGISSISLGQWMIVENSIFNSLPAPVGSWYEILHRELFCYVVAYLILTCLYSESLFILPLKRFLSLNLFYPIAQISYSAYLFHEMFMLWLFPQTAVFFKDYLSPLNIILVNGVICFVVIFFVASLMYLFIEQPFQRLRDKLTLKKRKIIIE